MREVRAATGVWRWRRQPLCRPTDLVEAWVALVAALLMVGCAPAVGWLAGSATDDSLRQSARQQRQQRHAVIATVLGPAPPTRSAAYDPDAPTAREKRRAVLARWISVDGGRHTGRVFTSPRTAHPGDRLTLWTDDTGRIVPPPLDLSTVRVHAALTGAGAAFAAMVLIVCVHRLLLWRLFRRRYARLDRAWAAVGPDWGRAGAGS
ncbi:hypothetical protein [Streptomyces sp. NPDC020965]|uniref:Rv1733c family protein n=1 Tax=Streptomyces sp. NPDC020965 TaxID=3365105 RepID=UPI0037AF7252